MDDPMEWPLKKRLVVGLDPVAWLFGVSLLVVGLAFFIPSVVNANLFFSVFNAVVTWCGCAMLVYDGLHKGER